MPALLQPHWCGSQQKRQSQPHSSRDSRMARSSIFSWASMWAIPEARNSARRRLVGSGCRKKQSSTSTPSTSRSSSDMSSNVSRSAWAQCTVPFRVNWEIMLKLSHYTDLFILYHRFETISFICIFNTFFCGTKMQVFLVLLQETALVTSNKNLIS